MCRWLERDPAGYQDGPSLYSYLGRNPMAGTDPYGLWTTEWHHIIPRQHGGLANQYFGKDFLHSADNGWRMDREAHRALHNDAKYNKLVPDLLRDLEKDGVLESVDPDAPDAGARQARNREAFRDTARSRITQDERFQRYYDRGSHAKGRWGGEFWQKSRNSMATNAKRLGKVVNHPAVKILLLTVSISAISEEAKAAAAMFGDDNAARCAHALVVGREHGRLWGEGIGGAIYGATGFVVGGGVGAIGGGYLGASAGGDIGAAIGESIAFNRFCKRPPGKPIPPPGSGLRPTAGAAAARRDPTSCHESTP